jgi:hypothetical protein
MDSKGLSWYREELEYDAQDSIERIKYSESKLDPISWGKEAIESITHEFDALSSAHKKNAASEFNDDFKYKTFITEAIDIKSLALKKLMIFVHLYIANDEGQTILQEVIHRPIIDYAKSGVLKEFETGILGFPWAQVVERSIFVDFGEWTPEGLDPAKIEKVIAELTANQELRIVTVGTKNVRLNFNDGWSTAELSWDGSAANVLTSVSVAALLLRCFSRLSNLSLRYCPQISNIELNMPSPTIFVLFSTFQWSHSSRAAGKMASMLRPGIR